jgi:hypothetical protein
LPNFSLVQFQKTINLSIIALIVNLAQALLKHC